MENKETNNVEEKQENNASQADQKIDFDSKKYFNQLSEQITMLNNEILDLKKSVSEKSTPTKNEDDEDILI